MRPLPPAGVGSGGVASTTLFLTGDAISVLKGSTVVSHRAFCIRVGRLQINKKTGQNTYDELATDLIIVVPRWYLTKYKGLANNC